ncbi:EAL domain-containing protein [Cyanobium sp. FGCU-52]|nr:EAL domain-containing protein [Cyanobium sp. FGCU52]
MGTGSPAPPPAPGQRADRLRTSLSGPRWLRWVPWIVLALGLGITALEVMGNRRIAAQILQLRSEQAHTSVNAALLDQLERTAGLLQSLGTVAEGSGSGQRFTTELDHIRHGHSFLEEGQPVAWIGMDGAGRPTLLGHHRKEGDPDQSLKAWRNVLTLPQVRRVLERSRDEDRPLLSEPIQEQIGSEVPRGSSLMLVVPIYGSGNGHGYTTASRRRDHRGWLALPLKVEALVDGALRTSQFQINEPVDIQLFRGDRARSDALIYDSTDGRPPAPMGGGLLRPMEAFGSRWLLGTRLAWSERENDGLDPWPRVLAAGLLLTALLTALPHRLLVLNRRRQQALEQVRLSAEAFRQIQEGVVIADPDGRRRMVNAAYCRMLGVEEAQLLQPDRRLLDQADTSRTGTETIWRAVRSSGRWEGEIWNRRADGSSFPGWLTLQALRDASGQESHTLATLVDLSRLQEKDDRLAHLGFHDPLTGVANLRLARLRLEEAIRRPGTGLHIFWIGLDGLQRINHSFGHEQGDRVLESVARRLEHWVGERDLLARAGNDEFVLLRERRAGEDDPAALAHALIDSLRPPLRIGAGMELELSGCAGVSICPAHGSDAGVLLQYAATALSEAKRNGPASVSLYDPQLTQQYQRRVQLESALQHAIARDELRLVYQPQTDGEGRLMGAECLLRWTSPDLGEVSPGLFIPVAEATGLIHQIGTWVLEMACRQAAGWRQQGLEPPPLAVNVSSRQLQDPGRDLAERVRQELDRSALPARQLEIEFTESCLLPASGALEMMERLAAMGVSLAVDDFGTGFSSLGVLHRFPIRRLKIDRAFITGIERRDSSQAIVKSILAMARELGLDTLAEGVERPEERQWLQQHGCDSFQGFLFSRPLSAEAFATLLSQPDRRLPLAAAPAEPVALGPDA